MSEDLSEYQLKQMMIKKMDNIERKIDDHLKNAVTKDQCLRHEKDNDCKPATQLDVRLANRRIDKENQERKELQKIVYNNRMKIWGFSLLLSVIVFVIKLFF